MKNIGQITLKFLSFNIRFDPISDTLGISNNLCPVQIHWKSQLSKTETLFGETRWINRKDKVVDTLQFYSPDIIGLQEVLHNQIQDLNNSLFDTYDFVGVGRNDGKKAGEYVPIFYKRNILKVMDIDHIWLSKTPHIPGSIGWDAGQTRMMTIVSFKYKMKNIFSSSIDLIVINTHFDELGVKSRLKSSNLILNYFSKKLKNLQENPAIILLGDLNSEPKEQAYTTLTNSNKISTSFYFYDSRYQIGKDKNSFLSNWYGYLHTFTGFKSSIQSKTIDYILIGNNRKVGKNHPINNLNVLSFAVVNNLFDDNIYISDHRPVIANLEGI